MKTHLLKDRKGRKYGNGIIIPCGADNSREFGNVNLPVTKDISKVTCQNCLREASAEGRRAWAFSFKENAKASLRLFVLNPKAFKAWRFKGGGLYQPKSLTETIRRLKVRAGS